MNGKIDIRVVRGWEELSQDELKYVFRLISAGVLPMRQIQVLCALRFSGLSSVAPRGRIFKYKGTLMEFTDEELGFLSYQFDWICQFPEWPVRLEKIGTVRALSFDLHELTFGEYLEIDNLYQGYLHDRDDSLIDRMTVRLYRSRHRHRRLRGSLARINTFYWWTSWKLWASNKWDTFLRKTNGGGVSPHMIRRAVDAQIRALTKGDIAKEEEILHSPAHRALTELDALAREAEELRRKK